MYSQRQRYVLTVHTYTYTGSRASTALPLVFSVEMLFRNIFNRSQHGLLPVLFGRSFASSASSSESSFYDSTVEKVGWLPWFNQFQGSFRPPVGSLACWVLLVMHVAPACCLLTILAAMLYIRVRTTIRPYVQVPTYQHSPPHSTASAVSRVQYAQQQVEILSLKEVSHVCTEVTYTLLACASGWRPWQVSICQCPSLQARRQRRQHRRQAHRRK